MERHQAGRVTIGSGPELAGTTDAESHQVVRKWAQIAVLVNDRRGNVSKVLSISSKRAAVGTEFNMVRLSCSTYHGLVHGIALVIKCNDLEFSGCIFHIPHKPVSAKDILCPRTL